MLRVLQEAIPPAASRSTIVKAESLLKRAGQVAGVVLQDVESGERVEVRCKAVINATGAWADRLRNEVNPEKRIRPLRGSHLVLPMHRLPVTDCAVTVPPCRQAAGICLSLGRYYGGRHDRP